MNPGYAAFDKLKAADRRDYFAAAAERIDTIQQATEKDFWVCRVIDAMFDGLSTRPKLFFKGGTSLSKGYGLIKRFSEDIDIVISRGGLGIKGQVIEAAPWSDEQVAAERRRDHAAKERFYGKSPVTSVSAPAPPSKPTQGFWRRISDWLSR